MGISDEVETILRRCAIGLPGFRATCPKLPVCVQSIRSILQPAHRAAITIGDDVAANALRAVVLAKTPMVEDEQAMLDYLTALPLAAWSAMGEHSPAAVRELTLSGIARSIAWRMAN